MTIYTLYWLRNKTHTDPYTQGYIGITSRHPEIRLREHRLKKGLTQDTILDILNEVKNKKEVHELECQYRPTPDIGWNVKSGGHHLTIHSDETKQRWSDVRKGKSSHLKGSTISEEHRAKISAAMKGRPSHWKGKTFSDEHRRKMSESKRRNDGTL